MERIRSIESVGHNDRCFAPASWRRLRAYTSNTETQISRTVWRCRSRSSKRAIIQQSTSVVCLWGLSRKKENNGSTVRSNQFWFYDPGQECGHDATVGGHTHEGHSHHRQMGTANTNAHHHVRRHMRFKQSFSVFWDPTFPAWAKSENLLHLHAQSRGFFMAPHCLPGDVTINLQTWSLKLRATSSKKRKVSRKQQNSSPSRHQAPVPTQVNRKWKTRQTLVEKKLSLSLMIPRRISRQGTWRSTFLKKNKFVVSNISAKLGQDPNNPQDFLLNVETWRQCTNYCLWASLWLSKDHATSSELRWVRVSLKLKRWYTPCNNRCKYPLTATMRSA